MHKLCHGCFTNIPYLAKRCPQCTSFVDGSGGVIEDPAKTARDLAKHRENNQGLVGAPVTGSGVLLVGSLLLSLVVSNWVNGVWPFTLWIIGIVLVFVRMIFRE